MHFIQCQTFPNISEKKTIDQIITCWELKIHFIQCQTSTKTWRKRCLVCTCTSHFSNVQYRLYRHSIFRHFFKWLIPGSFIYSSINAKKTSFARVWYVLVHLTLVTFNINFTDTVYLDIFQIIDSWLLHIL